MQSIKMILGGIGLLMLAICCILLIDIAQWAFLIIPAMVSLIFGTVLLIRGIFTEN
jgi:hypothetical protein